MGRSGYSEDFYDDDVLAYGRCRGAVRSAMRGRRGQAFLREMLAALDALPDKRLIDDELQDRSGAVCAIGAVGKARGIEMSQIDAYDHGLVSATFGIARAMACEIMFANDEDCWHEETPEGRFHRMRRWIESNVPLGGPQPEKDE